MKLAEQFIPRNGTLVFLRGEMPVSLEHIVFIDAHKIPADEAAAAQYVRSFSDSFIIAVRVLWSRVDCGEARYDEAFLASLRTFLKNREMCSTTRGAYEIIVPECGDDVVQSKEDAMQFTAAMCHTARRIKDCASVIGFAIPEIFSEQQADAFIEAMRVKHEHYVFFSKTVRADTVVY